MSRKCKCCGEEFHQTYGGVINAIPAPMSTERVRYYELCQACYEAVNSSISATIEEIQSGKYYEERRKKNDTHEWRLHQDDGDNS